MHQVKLLESLLQNPLIKKKDCLWQNTLETREMVVGVKEKISHKVTWYNCIVKKIIVNYMYICTCLVYNDKRL